MTHHSELPIEIDLSGEFARLIVDDHTPRTFELHTDGWRDEDGRPMQYGDDAGWRMTMQDCEQIWLALYRKVDEVNRAAVRGIRKGHALATAPHVSRSLIDCYYDLKGTPIAILSGENGPIEVQLKDCRRPLLGRGYEPVTDEEDSIPDSARNDDWPAPAHRPPETKRRLGHAARPQP